MRSFFPLFILLNFFFSLQLQKESLKFFFLVTRVGKGKTKSKKWAAVPELNSALLSACYALLIVRALLPLIGVKLAPSPWGSSSVCVCEERHGRVVWTDPGMH